MVGIIPAKFEGNILRSKIFGNFQTLYKVSVLSLIISYLILFATPILGKIKNRYKKKLAKSVLIWL